MNGIGSDAFCILWDGTKLVGLNASGHSPALMTPDKYEGQAKIADTGWGCVSTPGAVSLWMALHARYGKLPFADLFEPAIKYAHDGFRVSYMVARQWDAAIARLKGQDELGEGVPAQRPRAACRASSGSSPTRPRRCA